MDIVSWLFDGWTPLLRTVVIGAAAYAALVLILRASGKRTLSKMNAFDLVVTVAFGSTLASALVTKDVTVTQAATAFALLAALQRLVAWATVRSRVADRVVKSEPALLAVHGALLHDALHSEHVAEDEVMAAVRAAGKAELGDVAAVVLETNGALTVIEGSKAPAGVR